MAAPGADGEKPLRRPEQANRRAIRKRHALAIRVRKFFDPRDIRPSLHNPPSKRFIFNTNMDGRGFPARIRHVAVANRAFRG